MSNSGIAADHQRTTLTHLQRRRLQQLDQLDRRQFDSWTTSHWNSSKAANETLVALGLAERHGQTFYQPSGKVHNVGEARITEAGRQWLRSRDTVTA